MQSGKREADTDEKGIRKEGRKKRGNEKEKERKARDAGVCRAFNTAGPLLIQRLCNFERGQTTRDFASDDLHAYIYLSFNTTALGIREDLPYRAW